MEVTVSRPDKLLWPEPEVSKQVYVDYLGAVAEDMLPWLRARPLTLVRAPDGVGGERYFQKSAPSYAPSWIRTVEIPAPSAGKDVRYLVCDRSETLAWLGNQAAVEFHPAPVRLDRLDRPDLFVIDVDPPDEAFDAAVEATRLVLEVLSDLGIDAALKTTGGKGLHVVVPIERRYGANELRAAAATLTDLVASRRPDFVTGEFRKAKRAGRVMLDPSRNAPGATVVAPYSPRARAEGTVSFPLVPDDLGRVRPEEFTIRTVPDRLRDPGPAAWRELSNARPQRLPQALRS
ncbi:MAG TPA: non-homologous end-joining DNA ligase [Actinomycetota bacterium]|jgi:bifunctional non-homologous end joining protein LigD